MGGKGGSPPPAPDYAGMAAAQGAANVQAAKQTAYLSNPNVISPTGKRTVSYSTTYAKPEPVKPVGMTAEQAAAQLQSQGINAPVLNPKLRNGKPIFDSQMQAYQGQLNALMNPNMDAYNKALDEYKASEIVTPTITEELTPEAQAAFNAQQKTQQALSELGYKATGTVSDVMSNPFAYTGPGIQTSLGNTGQVNTQLNLQGQATGGPAAGQYGWQQGGVESPEYQTGLDGYGQVSQTDFNAPNMQGLFGGFGEVGQNLSNYDLGNVTQNQFNAPNLQTQLSGFGDVARNQFNAPELQGQFGGFNQVSQDRYQSPELQQSIADSGQLTRGFNTENLAAMPVNAGTTAQQAIMSRLQPQLEQQRSALQTQLANQGITPGSTAYENAMTEQNQRENDLTTQAALQGLNLDMAARQQGFGEAQASAGFSNEAQQQAFNQALAAGQYGNQAAIAQFGAGLQGQQAANAAQQQAFQQAMQQSAFGNEAAINQLNAQIASQQATNQAQQQAYLQALGTGQFGNEAALAANNQMIQNQNAQNAAQQQAYQQALGQAQFANTAQQQAYQQALGQAQFGNESALAGFNAQIAGQNAQNAAQQQAFNQAVASGQFGNEAQTAAFQAALANQQAGNQASAANFAQAQSAAQMGNQALGQNWQNQLAQWQAQNAAQNQQYNQALQSAQFANTADQQEFQRQLGLYNLPLNQVTALMSGGQVQMPTFQPYQGAGVTAAPMFQAGQAQYQAGLDAYNANVASANSQQQGLIGVGMMAATAY